MTSPPNIYQNFPNIGKTVLGRDFNYYQSFTVSTSTFGGDTDGYAPDQIISFTTQGIIFTNETSGAVVGVSFNGNTLHCVLDGTPTSTTRVLTFNNRVISKMWFRLISGSPATITVNAWAVR